ncbi:Metastasis-associated protein MTA3, partial [Fragariocoptes setiger]
KRYLGSIMRMRPLQQLADSVASACAPPTPTPASGRQQPERPRQQPAILRPPMSSPNLLLSQPRLATTILECFNHNNISDLQQKGSNYRIGDCVYFETTSTTSYQIGRIDELCRVGNGDQIEIKAVVFFRRHDISSSLITLADKYQYDESQEAEIEQMSEKAKHLLKQRELFYSRQIETLPATSIRGKCSVQLLNESESFSSYLNKEDHFFYTLVYDPHQKTLLADRGEIRVGQRYQAEVSPRSIYTPAVGGDPQDPRDLSALETLVYTPDHNLTDEHINKFITIAKSVGTFARALDCTSSIKQPSLHLTAASASRDVTLLYAMTLLHENDYDLGKACCALIPSTGPVLCRDEIEEWSAAEATLFEEAIEKYGREFGDIRQDFLPWKSMKNIIEYYYMWKTTDRSVQQKRMKAIEAENKLKEIKVPLSQRHGALNGLPDGHPTSSSGRPCESCGQTLSPRWHSWGSAHMECRLCNECWIYWKKYGGLKFVDRLGETKRRQLTTPSLISQINFEGIDRKTEDLMFVASKATKKMRRSFSEEQYKRFRRRPWVAINKP